MSESVTGVGKELSQTLVWTAKNLRTKVRLQNMPVVAKVVENTIWYRWCLCLKICIQTVTTCCTVYRSLRTPETVAKCYLKSIDTTIVKEMNEMAFFSSVSQCTRICSSVQSGDRNLCYAAAIRGMSGHKEQIGNNHSKRWFDLSVKGSNCTFKL